MKSKNKQAFTLIELLVVIAIIAMLLSILLPSLSAVKQQAMKTVCMTHLVQMGALFTLYAENNDDLLFPGYYRYTAPDGTVHQSELNDTWPYVMEPYYEDSDLRFCPAAKHPRNRSYSGRSAWGDASNDIFSGSYGLNGWVCNPPDTIAEIEGRDTAHHWRTLYPDSNRSKIPLMADAYWFTGLPRADDLPPESNNFMQASHYDGTAEPEQPSFEIETDHQMRRFCVDRHRKELNVLFLDGRVEAISPKQLWRLKWHREYDTNAPLPEWPEWMLGFKDADKF